MPSRFLLPVLALAVYNVGAAEFMLSPLLTPLAAAFDTTPAQASWLIASYALSYALAAPIFGFLSDRIDRRRLLLVSLWLFALDGLALTLAPNFSVAIGLRIIGGLASAALIPTVFALIAERIPAARQVSAMGAVSLGMTMGIALGPVFAALLADRFDWRAPFWLTAASCLLVFGIAYCVVPPTVADTRRTPGSSLASLCRQRILRPLIAKGAWNGTAVTGFLLAGEVLRQRNGLSTGAVGGLVSAFGFGLGLGNVFVGPVCRIFRRDEIALLLATLLAGGIVAVFMLAPLTTVGTLLCLTAWGMALGVAAPVSTALLARRGGRDKGMVLALSESLNNLTVLALLPVAAALLATQGAAAAMWVLGAGFTVGIGLTAADLRAELSQRL